MLSECAIGGRPAEGDAESGGRRSAEAAEPSSSPAPAPAVLPAQPAKNEDVLLVIESELVQTKAKLSLAVESFASLLASAQKELEITEPIVLCKAAEAGEPIVVLTELGELENKMKVQVLRADGAGKAVPPPMASAAQQAGDAITYSRRMKIDRVDEALFQQQEDQSDSSDEDEGPHTSDDEAAEPEPEPRPLTISERRRSALAVDASLLTSIPAEFKLARLRGDKMLAIAHPLPEGWLGGRLERGWPRRA